MVLAVVESFWQTSFCFQSDPPMAALCPDSAAVSLSAV